MLKEFSQENDLGSLKEETQFEHFVSYAVVQRLYGETFDTDDIVLGNDEFGIDGIGIIVNGVLVPNIDAFASVNDGAVSLDVSFVSCRLTGPSRLKLGRWATSLLPRATFSKKRRNS